MKKLGFYKLFFILGSGFLGSVWAQKSDSLESGQEKGYPWIAHSSIDAFYLNSPVAPGKADPYQVSLYQGVTVQSLSFASFHIGLRSRETLGPGFSTPYREPFELKLSGTTEIFRDLLYVSLGGNVPIYSGSFQMEDTAALFNDFNVYSPMPYSAYISPRALQAGVFGRYAWSAWTSLFGFTYTRPAKLDIIPNHSFYPAPMFSFSGRAILESGASKHRLDLKATFYTPEGNELHVLSHDEGDVWQLRYGYLKGHAKVAWQGGLGVVFHMPDANRKYKIESVLEKTVSNDNIQRAYGEFSFSWVPHPDILWRFYLLPKVLYSYKDLEFGNETELGFGFGLKIWDVHRVRAVGNFLYGNFSRQQYSGFGIKGEFSFRHLGFQDIEEPADTEIQ